MIIKEYAFPNAFTISEYFLKLYNILNFLFLNSSNSGTFAENPPYSNQKVSLYSEPQFSYWLL